MRLRWGRTSAAMVVSLGIVGLGSATAAHAATSARASAHDKKAARITVWVDAVRVAGIHAYQQSHPHAPVNLVTIPNTPGYLETKIALANRAGGGLPDVVFLNSPADVASLAATPFNYALNIKHLVSGSVLNNFGASNAGCTFGSRLYCLRDDIGQTVLWYNAKEMAQFGYKVPTTWSQYQALGEKVAKQHPGYIIGSLGGKWGAGTFFSASGCKTRAVANLSSVEINTSARECTRVARLLQPLVNDGTVTALDWSDPAVVQMAGSGKVLMMPGPSWFGLDAFDNIYKVPAGQMAAAPMPTWPGQTTGTSGSVGGGMWLVFRHATRQEKKAALQLVEWMTTNSHYQATQPTYPAYAPAAKAWCAEQSKTKYFVGNPCPVLAAEAAQINPVHGMIRFEAQWWNSYDSTIQAAAQGKASLLNALQQWGSQLQQAARETSYSVKK